MDPRFANIFFEFQERSTQYTSNNNPPTYNGNYTRESVALDYDFGTETSSSLRLIESFLIHNAFEIAETKWSTGYCVEIQVPDLGTGVKSVQPNSDTPFTANVHHRFEGVDLQVPVIAMLSDGQVSVSPSGSKVPAPASFTYKAPGENNKTATVNLVTRSKRGIATLDVKFKTGEQGWKVDGPFGESRIFGEICSLDVPFTLNWDSGVGLAGTVTFSPTSKDGGTWSLEGAMASVGVTNAGEGNYTIQSNTENNPTALVLDGTGTQTTAGFGTFSFPFSGVIQLDPSPCSQP
jgi:hypothetical protein